MKTLLFKMLRFSSIILAVGVGCLARLAGAVFFVWTNIYIPHSRHKAEARWAAIGRPMPEFVKHLGPVEENESLRALTCNLQPFGVISFYKARNEEQSPNTINIPKDITDFIHTSSARTADHVDAAAQEFSYLDEHAGDLDRLYQGILHGEPAVWSFVLQDGMSLRVASFLAARGMSQLIYVDALRKLERRDEKGATDAVAAGLKMTSSIDEQPILVSQMFRVAITGLFAPVIARLPEDNPDGLERLATEVESRREKWRAAVQGETWAVMQAVDYMGLKPKDFTKLYKSVSISRKIHISHVQSLLESDGNRFISCAADQVAISEKVKDLALSDLGASKMNEAISRHAPVLTLEPPLASWSEAFRPTWWCRSWVRLNAVLLLREQAELIRSARAQV